MACDVRCYFMLSPLSKSGFNVFLKGATMRSRELVVKSSLSQHGRRVFQLFQSLCYQMLFFSVTHFSSCLFHQILGRQGSRFSWFIVEVDLVTTRCWQSHFAANRHPHHPCNPLPSDPLHRGEDTPPSPFILKPPSYTGKRPTHTGLKSESD